MIKSKYVIGIALVLLLGIITVVMADAPVITFVPPTPDDDATITVDYVNVSIITTGTTGIVYINWNNEGNVTMEGSGNHFYKNKTGLIDETYNYIVYANDSTPENWTASPKRAVKVSTAASASYSAPEITSPTAINITDTSADISFNLNQSNAKTRVYFGTTEALGTWSEWNNISSYSRTIPLTGLSEGTTYYYSIFAYNASNQSYFSNTSIQDFGIFTPTSPNITNIVTDPPSASSVNVSFEVNQSNAKTRVQFGTTEALGTWSEWNNNTDLSRTIPLTGLSEGTTYYYSVFAYNASNQSYFSNTSIKNFGTVTPTSPNITTIVIDTPSASSVNVSFEVNQSNAKTRVQFSTTEALGTWSEWNNNTDLSRTIPLTGINEGTKYYFSIFAYNGTNQNYFSNSSIQNFTTKYPGPVITDFDPSDTTLDITEDQSQPLWVKANQNVTVNWYINNGSSSVKTETVDAGVEANYTFLEAKGTYFVTANASNANGSDTQNWTVNVHPKTYFTGDRVWDENRHSSSEYKWNVYSFPGFYYNLDDDVGTEELTIKNIGRTINENDMVYKTSPQEVGFGYENFGNYQVIGFMAEKYFAGYTSNTTITGVGTKSALSAKQLHKVLLDDDKKRTVSEGGTLTLEEGYVLKMTQVDIGAGTGQIWISLLKDGGQIDSDVVEGGEEYVYMPKKVGKVSDLPIIVIHFDKVFRGTEINAAFIEGIFQISESYTSVSSGDNYGEMEVKSVGTTEIEMKNENTIDLSRGNTIDLMGNLQIVVADSDDLRFAMSVERTGTFEARGTIYPATHEWTPMNFGLNVGGTSIGFYYNIDDDIGTENLKVTISGTSIQGGGLVYSTTPDEVSFGYDDFGKYEVIGFLADKYFAGYTSNTTITGVGTKSALSAKQLHKVLLDDEEKRTISEGGTLTLEEGYVLKMTQVDIGAGTGQIWITLLKDGNEVDTDVVEGGEEYIYTPKKVGKVSDLPIIVVHFDKVFRGGEINAAFIEGIFQISESYTSVSSGDNFGEMEVKGVTGSGIEMKNENTIDLSPDSVVDLMGDIKFNVADDSNALRFYPFVEVTSEMIATQLVIDTVSKANAGENISITVRAGGSPLGGVSISLDSDIGQTDANGVLKYALPRTLVGMYNITATKLGYEKAIKSLEVEKYLDLRLSIDAPVKATQFETISILVLLNGTPMPGAIVTYDEENIGNTDINGILNYTLESSAIHTITASKSGYITVSREIEVEVPYSEYKALDINLSPPVIFEGEETVIKANITNTGTKADDRQVELIINGSVVDNRSLVLKPGDVKEINFTRTVELPKGNYTVEILGQKDVLRVDKKETSLLWIGGILTGIGAILIYLFTSKKITVAMLKESIANLNAESVKEGLRNAGWKLKDMLHAITGKFRKQ